MQLILQFLEDYLFITNVVFILIIVFIEKKKPVYTLFWVVMLLLMPYTGFFLYLFLGLSFRKSRVIKKFYGKSLLNFNSKDLLNNPSLHSLKKWMQLIEYLEVSQAGNLTSYKKADLFTTGNQFFSVLIKDILKSQDYIYMEYYIFKDDALGNALISAILKKAEEGVKIHLILDGTNSLTLKKIAEFKKYGIKVELFFPSFFHHLKIANIRANYRDHRKITVIDGKVGYLGGFNIGNEYVGKSKFGYWKDSAVRLTGNVMFELEKEFTFSWNFIQGTNRKNFLYPRVQNLEKIDNNFAQLVSSGPNFQLHTARDNLLRIIMNAKSHIYIETPYFIPDETIMEALKIASLGGVRIKVIMPKKPDHLFVYWINQSFARELAEYGIKFYRYNKGFIHSKVVIADGSIVSLGTVNIDYRSFFSNFEININFYEGDIVRKSLIEFAKDLNDSTIISFDEESSNAFSTRIKESIFRLLSPIF